MALKIKTTTYKKLKGSAGSQGTDYQIKLLEYFLMQGFDSEGDFLLSTENEEAGIFDDLIYQTQDRTVLLQAKHTCRNISFDQLFSLKSIKGDFNLYKYLKTFPAIVNNFGNENIHVIICTNGKFNEERINLSLNKETKTNKIKYLKQKSLNFIFQFNNVESYYFDSNQDVLVKYISKNASHQVSQKDIKLFLDKLLLVSVSDKDLDDGIEYLIEKINFTEKINSKLIRSTIFNKVKLWFQSVKGTYLTKENTLAYFSELLSQNYIHLKINILSLLKDEYNKMLEKDNYPNSLTDNVVLLKIQSRETYDLHEFKIFQFLLNNFIFLYNETDKEKLRDQILFVNPQCSENMASIIKSFEIPEYVHLVVPFFELQIFNKTKDLIKNLIEVQKIKQYKKIIFIVDTAQMEYEINQISPNIKKFVVNIKLSDFSETAQNQILQREIKFQGNKISLQNIIDNKNVNLDDLIDEDTLLRLVINNKQIVINNIVKTYEETNYVNRFFNKTDEKLNPETEFKYTEMDFSELILKECDVKFMVLYDSPGMGKSTVLNHLYYLLRTEPYWIIKVNLNDCTRILWKLRKEKRKFFTLDEFLNLIQYSKESQLERKIFNIPNNVVLLFDALDEISPDYADLILNAFSLISKNNNIRKIVVTSRTHVVKYFEEKNITCETYALVPFSEKESIKLLSMFWEKEHGKNKLERIKQFAENLINELNKKTSWGRIKTLIGIPLQTKMIGDIFAKYCKDFLENPESRISLPEILNLSWLYDEFIERKKDIYIEEKCNAGGNLNIIEAVENQFENAINEHIKKALKLEFPEDFHDSFKILDTSRKSEEKILLKMGILVKSDDKIQFVHKTLSEYFVEKYICEMILNNEISEYLLKYLVRSNFLRQNMFIKYMLEYKSIPNEFKTQFFNLIDGVEIKHLIRYQTEFILFLITKSGYKKLFELNCAETLHECVGHKHTEEFLKKLEVIENFNELKDEDGNTPLHLACMYNSNEIVELLLGKQHLIDVPNNYGRTPLHDVTDSGNVSMVKFLIDKGHPTGVRDHYGTTPLHYAARLSGTTIVKLLIDNGHPIDIIDENGRTPLHDAIEWGKVTTVELLIDKGHPIDFLDRFGRTSLHNAIRCNKMTAAKLLIDKGHPIDVPDNYGRTPLHNAIRWKKTTSVELLIDNGHPLDIRDNYGTTPLHYAARLSDTTTVELLVDKGHPIDARDSYGRTPLHNAIRWNKVNTVKLLLDKGHPIDLCDNDGQTPLGYATEHHLTDIQNLFKKCG